MSEPETGRALLRNGFNRAFLGVVALVLFGWVQFVAWMLFFSPPWLDPVLIPFELLPTLVVMIALEATEDLWCRGPWSRSLAFLAAGLAGPLLVAIPPVWFPALIGEGPRAAYQALGQAGARQLWLEPGLALGVILVWLAHVRAQRRGLLRPVTSGVLAGALAGAAFGRIEGAIVGALAGLDLAIGLHVGRDRRPAARAIPTGEPDEKVRRRVLATTTVCLAAISALLALSFPRRAREESAATLRHVALLLANVVRKEIPFLSGRGNFVQTPLDEVRAKDGTTVEGFRLELATDSRTKSLVLVANPVSGRGPCLSADAQGVVRLHEGRGRLDPNAPLPAGGRRLDVFSFRPGTDHSLFLDATDPCAESSPRD